ncbi:MAG TPA: SDR family oxidoreductase, partial [Pirellulaceae bacterium]|nr:SDR family oxidoreductase [Pirellulaceae bacterium]
MAKLIFGCGYLGRRVAGLWQQRGDVVYAVTRAATRAESLRREGIRPLIADITAAFPTGERFWPAEIDTVLYAVGYDRGSAASIHDVYVGGLGKVLDGLTDSVKRLIYVSSVGVYGDAGGDWVDEEAPCRPIREGGKASLAAEELLKAHRLGNRAIILRLAGIYGPGRIPRSEALVTAQPIDAPAEGYLNLIHVDDAAAIVLLAEAKASLPRTYVVSDGQPVVRGDYYRELARLLAAPAPVFVPPTENTPAAQRAAGNKRVNNRRLKDELAPKLRYPS